MIAALALGVSCLALAVSVFVAIHQVITNRRAIDAGGEELRVRGELSELILALPKLLAVPMRLESLLAVKKGAALSGAISELQKEEWLPLDISLRTALRSAQNCGHISEKQFADYLMGDESVFDAVLNCINILTSDRKMEGKKRSLEKLLNIIDKFEKEMREIISTACRSARQRGYLGKIAVKVSSK